MTTPAVGEAAGEDRVDGGLGLGERRRDDDALAGGEPVGLDDDRRGHPPQVVLRRPGRLEALIGRGGDGVRPAEILGEALGGFELCRRAGRARTS